MFKRPRFSRCASKRVSPFAQRKDGPFTERTATLRAFANAQAGDTPFFLNHSTNRFHPSSALSLR